MPAPLMVSCYYYSTFARVPQGERVKGRNLTVFLESEHNCSTPYYYIPWFALLNLDKIRATLMEEDMDFD